MLHVFKFVHNTHLNMIGFLNESVKAHKELIIESVLDVINKK